MTSLRVRGRKGDGFSMIELLVTIVLAGIIFAAMVPFFANALKRTSGDRMRNDADLIAQDRLEQAHLVDYDDLDRLNDASFSGADGRWGPNYTLTGTSKAYKIIYVVDPAPADVYGAIPTTTVTTKVTWPGGNYTTQKDTVIRNPVTDPLTSTIGPTPSVRPTTGLYITCTFKDWQQVTSEGVTVRRVQTNVTPNVTTTPTPLKLVPNASSTSVTWTGLAGGTAIYTYYVTCHSQYITATAPGFHLLTSAKNVHFDTHPGGS